MLIFSREAFFSVAGLGCSEDLTLKHVEFGSLGPYLCLYIYFWHDWKSSMSGRGGRGMDGRKSKYTFLCAYVLKNLMVSF